MPAKDKPDKAAKDRPVRETNAAPKRETYKEMVKVAKENGFRVTSTTGDKHNTGSAHYDGRAIDVSVRNKSAADIERLEKAAKENNWKVRDERTRPPNQKVWSGPHLHIEAPKKRN